MGLHNLHACHDVRLTSVVYHGFTDSSFGYVVDTQPNPSPTLKYYQN